MDTRSRGWLTRALLFALAAALLFNVGTPLLAQTQTGQITGTVESSDKTTLPGVTVTVSSPALLGTRSAVTDASGYYTIPGLPPGTYSVEFVLSGFATVKRTAVVPLGRVAEASAALSVSGIEETVTVTADVASVINTPQVATTLNFKETVDKLSTDGPSRRLPIWRRGSTTTARTWAWCRSTARSPTTTCSSSTASTSTTTSSAPRTTCTSRMPSRS